MNPILSSISEHGDIYKFTIGGINVSLANAIRRTILSDIPTGLFIILGFLIYKSFKGAGVFFPFGYIN